MSYEAHTHVGGTKLRASALNHMEKGISEAHEELEKKVSSSGHTPNQFLGTDEKGNVVTKNAPDGSSDSGENVNGGVSTSARNLLITALRNGRYISNQAANITALEAALASGGGDSGGDSGGDTGGDDSGGGAGGAITPTWNDGYNIVNGSLYELAAFCYSDAIDVRQRNTLHVDYIATAGTISVPKLWAADDAAALTGLVAISERNGTEWLSTSTQYAQECEYDVTDADYIRIVMQINDRNKVAFTLE